MNSVLRRGLSIAVLLACACIPGTAASQAASPPRASVPGSVATATIRDERGALEQATALENTGDQIAGPLVVALSEQFGGRHVDLWLEDIDVAPLAHEASIISGTGQAQVEGRRDPVGFRFKLPWNASLQRAGYPQVSVAGAIAGERDVPNDVGLVSQLEANVTAALAHHLRKPSTSVRLDRIATVQGGREFLRINAVGVAYLGRDGASTTLTIQALYDRTRRAWTRLEYGLGEEAARVVSRSR